MSANPEQFYYQIAQSLAGQLPQSWVRACVEAKIVKGFTELKACYYPSAEAREPTPVHAGDAADAAFERLRDFMARHNPGKGAWYTASFTLFPDGNFDLKFDYDNKPQFSVDLDKSYFAEDAKSYPREKSKTPTWLSELN
jgi:hypothetical protein